jgi:tRNA(fMet)-specific endonuclease VapC
LAAEFLLDSNALVHVLKGKGRVAERLTQTNPSRVAIPSVVVYEMEYGTLRSANPRTRRTALHRILDAVEILPFDRRAAEQAALIRLQLEKRGEIIGPFDLMIVGTALAFGCVLVTHNTAEFSRVPGLRVEDWF